MDFDSPIVSLDEGKYFVDVQSIIFVKVQGWELSFTLNTGKEINLYFSEEATFKRDSDMLIKVWTYFSKPAMIPGLL